MLRVPGGPGGRKSKHRVRSAGKGHPCPGGGGKQGKLAPLGDAGGHDHRHTVGSAALPGLGQVEGVALVKGVVFGNHSDGAHEHASFPFVHYSMNSAERKSQKREIQLYKWQNGGIIK